MKPKKLIKFLFLTTLLALPCNAFSQKPDEKTALDEGTIEEQINYVVDKSHMYEEFFVVKSNFFDKLKKHMLDTMKFVHKDLLTRQATIENKSVQIDSLNSQLLSTQAKLDNAILNKNSLKFLGMNMSKAAYNSMVWFIIAALSTGMVIFILMFKRSYSIIRGLRDDLELTREEFEKHRKRALEREEQVVHKYHAELNKYKGKVK